MFAIMRFIFFCIVFLLAICVSCTDSAYFEQNKAIESRAWEYNEIPEFAVRIDDSTARYDLFINLRHSGGYDFSNMYVLLHQKGSKLLDTAYRKEIPLAELDGRWLGKSAGALYEVQYLAHQNFVFPDTGVYTFGIEQNMRQNPLMDVADVGIKLVKK